ncbi:TPM domain-containing protein [Methyloligella solikamskensis]|uniref:TPM domain-containing protein n=1 Tax=Methyloligella solikamskensis TaxID=1177756 RepID=A0ABW3J5Z7_9HYPH
MPHPGRQLRSTMACLAGVLTVLALYLFLPATVHAAPDFPALTGRVVDDANLLNPSQETDLTARLKALEDETSDQLVVVTLPSLQGETIEDFGYQLGRHWGIGTKQLDNGVLLIVAPKERKVRIEVGYGLEGKLTDILTHLIIENSILPRFRNGDFPGGIESGVDDITLALTGHEEELQQRAVPPQYADDEVDWITIIIWIVIIAYVVYVLSYGPGPGTGSGRRSSWGGGSSGGGFGGGGGFSGGGGGFGGGGSSGSW